MIMCLDRVGKIAVVSEETMKIWAFAVGVGVSGVDKAILGYAWVGLMVRNRSREWPRRVGTGH